MIPKILLLSMLMSVAAIVVIGQTPSYPKPGHRQQLPFGRKMSPPKPNPTYQSARKQNSKEFDLPFTTFDTISKQFKVHRPGQRTESLITGNSVSTDKAFQKFKGTPLDVRLTKDINALSESFPRNYPANNQYSYAVINNASYFFADDGVHGSELWRSDGTSAGTYLVKDINPGTAHGEGGGIIVANNLLYFSAYGEQGLEPWVSDGTGPGTHLLKDLHEGFQSSSPNQFVSIDGSVFFCASVYGYNSQLWKTDGTEANTVLVKDLEGAGIGYYILELTKANGLVYFIAYTFNSGVQLFRSDGTEAGTYIVNEMGYGDFSTAPMQLTEYNSALYFSADYGNGRRLWRSDGTNEGTNYAPGNNEVFLRTDYMDVYKNFPFRIINNVLFISGSQAPYTGTGDLYKYDASNADGIVLAKQFENTADVNFIVPVDMAVVNDDLFFKVISNTNGYHDELWKLTTATEQTQLVKSFAADSGVYTYNFYGFGSELYFVTHDDIYGNELWKTDGTDAGTMLAGDINPGVPGSFPDNLTFCNGKLLFTAFNYTAGTELWTTSGTASGISLVKDINTTSTNSSFAGSNYFYKSTGTSAKGLVFNAVTADLGSELYQSDGTSAGTVLLNEIYPGDSWSYPNNFLFKNGVTYFIGDNATGTAIYKTDGTPQGLQRTIPYINRNNYSVVNYNICDNGLLFYTLYNLYNGQQELWRSNGTDIGTYLLTSSLAYYYNNYAAVSGNTVYFIGGDFSSGYELWKSDGTLSGTKMVKDINAGFAGSDPYSLFIHKKHVYFGATDDGSTYSLWKSDGSEAGTVELKNITPGYYFSYFNPEPQHVFCESNSTLYFTASDFNTVGGELWRTDGTPAGTILVKDINPYSDSYPNFFTDVKGILYFTADDGVHGNEVWKSNGTAKSTQLVKDITTDYAYYYDLCSSGDRLFFLSNSSSPTSIWSSDGTVENTNVVNDEVLNGLASIENLNIVGDKLFFGGYSYKYGYELYKGNVNGKFSAVRLSDNSRLETASTAFDAMLYPNPTNNTSILIVKGNSSHVAVSISDMAGRLVWLTNNNYNSRIEIPVAKFAAGEYIVTVISGTERKLLKLVRK